MNPINAKAYPKNTGIPTINPIVGGSVNTINNDENKTLKSNPKKSIIKNIPLNTAAPESNIPFCCAGLESSNLCWNSGSTTNSPVLSCAKKGLSPITIAGTANDRAILANNIMKNKFICKLIFYCLKKYTPTTVASIINPAIPTFKNPPITNNNIGIIPVIAPIVAAPPAPPAIPPNVAPATIART